MRFRRLEVVLHRVLRYVPIEIASAIGGFGVRTNVRYNLTSILHNARANVRRHKPELPETEVERIVWSYLDNVGRQMAEFSQLHKLIPQNRITFSGFEVASRLVGEVPTISLVLHLANWEVLGPGMKKLGLPIASFYEPPNDPFHLQVAEETRRASDIQLLTPDRQGLREAMTLLNAKKIVAIFPDEARKGRTMAPLFGRPPHDRGNLAIAAKLARRSGAQIVVTHCRRVGGSRFHLTFEAPVFLPEPSTGLLDDIAFLNAQIEPIILSNLDQWYYLDDSIDPLE